MATNAQGNQFVVGIPGLDQNGTSSGAVQVYTSNTVACTQPLDITIHAAPSIDLGADTTLICAGTSETLDAGTGFASYLWSDGSAAQTLSASTAGTYTVTGTDANGCSASDSMVIDVLIVDISQNDTTICEGDSLVLLANGNGGSAQNGNSQLSGNLNNGLVGYWPFSGNANDESGNGNNGTVNGATLASDRFGNNDAAYNFSNSSNSNNITVSNNFFDNGWTNSTISLWFNPYIGNNGGINGAIINTVPHNGVGLGFSNYGNNQKLYFSKDSDPNNHSWDIISGGSGNAEFNQPIFNLNTWYFDY